MRSTQRTTLFVVLLSVWSKSVTAEDKIDWIKKSDNGGSIDFTNTKLLLKIKAGSWEPDLRIDFKDSRGNEAGSFLLDFFREKYGFPGCTSFSSAGTALKTSLPKPDKAGYRIFMIEAYGEKGQGLKISCNGTVLITLDPSKKACSQWGWDSVWNKKKAQLDFTWDRAISEYAKVPYADCKKLNATLSRRGVTTVPALPVKHKAELKLRCPLGTVNKGGNSAVCEDGVIRATNSTPICKYKGISTDTTTAAPVVRTDAPQNIDWKKKPSSNKGASVNFTDSKLLLRTKAEKGDMRINFQDSSGKDAGSFLLDLTKSKYGFLGCTDFMSATEELKTSLPKQDNAGYRIFVIEAYGKNGLKISCNGTVLVTLEPSKKACSYRLWDDYWNKRKANFDFTYDWAISEYAKVSFAVEKKSKYEKWRR